jgi:hypothetical protein
MKYIYRRTAFGDEIQKALKIQIKTFWKKYHDIAMLYSNRVYFLEQNIVYFWLSKNDKLRFRPLVNSDEHYT